MFTESKASFTVLFSFLISFSTLANAESLKLAEKTKDIEGVAVHGKASLSIGGAAAKDLVLVGAGLRNKKVVFVKVKVYVAELFASKKPSAEEFKSLDKLSSSAPLAIRLEFLRDVEAEKVRNSFKESLEKNNIDLKDANIQKLLQAVADSGEVKKSKQLVFAGQVNADGTDTVVFENTKGEATSATGKDLIKSIFSIWLGEMTDDELAELKKQLIS